MGRHSSGERITLAAARELALSAERYRQRRKCITILKLKVMVIVNFITAKSETLFLSPTIAVEKQAEKTAIRFAFWHGVFSIEVIKLIKPVKA